MTSDEFLATLPGILLIAGIAVNILWEDFGEELKRRKTMTKEGRKQDNPLFYLVVSFKVVITIFIVLGIEAMVFMVFTK